MKLSHLARVPGVLGGIGLFVLWPAAVLVVFLVCGLFLFSPALGLLALLVGNLLVQVSVPIGAGADLNFPMLVVPVLLVLWIHRLCGSSGLGRLWFPPFPGLAAFMTVAVLSFVLANVGPLRFALATSPQDWLALARPAPIRAQVGQLGIFGICIGTFVLVADQVASLRWLRAFTSTFLLLGAACIACWVVPELRLVGQLIPPGVGDGSLFWIWLVALASTQAAFNGSLPPGVRLALGIVVAAAFYVAAGDSRDWLSGWAPALVALVAGLSFGAPRLAIAAMIVGPGLLFATGETARLLAIGERLLTSLSTVDNQYSMTTRLEAWRILGTMILANLPLGLGPANYHHYAVHFPILGYNVQFSSHNNYIDIVAQTGIAGFACLGWFAWWIGRLGWKLRAEAPAGFARAYVLGALAGLAGTLAAGMLGDWFLPFVYNTGRVGLRASMLGWFFLGGLIVVRHAAIQEPGPADPAGASLRR